MANKKEPTNRDILEGMNKRFKMTFTELKKNDVHFALAFRQLTSLHAEIKDIKKQQEADGEVLGEMQEILTAVAKAVDADAMTIVDHEDRITKLEKVHH